MKFSKALSVFLTLVLLFSLAACGKGTKTSTDAAESKTEETKINKEIISLGKGETCFSFSVYHADGSVKNYEISTDKALVGEALSDVELISGEEGPYGLYVKTVDGINHDYETDGTYWAFYEGDNMAAAGVDMTEIKKDTVYSFRAEKQ